ncbi:MAG TPA: ERF family protein [Sphingomicrobium sp.]|jgi:hypothetical protein
MIEQSETIAKLTTALVQVQATVEGASKGRVNPAFKSKYADLSSVWEACREQLVTNGLTVVQFPGEMVDNRMTMTTQLSHESGEWMRGTLSIPLTKADAQGYGSAVTYARRYALAAVVGVCPEDDDGNAASQRGPRQEPVSARINEDQRNILLTLAQQSGANMKGFCTFFGIDSLPQLPATKFTAAKEMFEKKLAAKTEQQEAA